MHGAWSLQMMQAEKVVGMRGIVNAKLKTRNAKRQTQNSKLKTQNSKLKTSNAWRRSGACPFLRDVLPRSMPGGAPTPQGMAPERLFPKEQARP